MIYIFVFILQFLSAVAKTLEIKLTYENKIAALVWNCILINALSIVATFFSLKCLLNGDWIIAIVYIIGSVLGKWVSMKFFDNHGALLLKHHREKSQNQNQNK